MREKEKRRGERRETCINRDWGREKWGGGKVEKIEKDQRKGVDRNKRKR